MTRADPDDGVIGRESVHIWRVPALAEFVCCCTQHSINITCLSVSYIHQTLTSTSTATTVNTYHQLQLYRYYTRSTASSPG